MFLTVGIAGIIIGARLKIELAIDIATYLGIPALFIGATLVAFGTSLYHIWKKLRCLMASFIIIDIILKVSKILTF